MEHRWSPRLPASLEVRVFHRQRLLGLYSTHDVSLDGMLLDMDPGGLARNDVIELRLGTGSEARGMRGMVVHLSRRGVGIMLDKVNNGYFLAVMALYRAPRSEIGAACPSAPVTPYGRCANAG